MASRCSLPSFSFSFSFPIPLPELPDLSFDLSFDVSLFCPLD